MKPNCVDILIYIQSKVEPEIISNAVAMIGELGGVINASINPRVGNLLSIEYNPNDISGKTILNVARQNGFAASLIGM